MYIPTVTAKNALRSGDKACNNVCKRHKGIRFFLVSFVSCGDQVLNTAT